VDTSHKMSSFSKMSHSSFILK